MKRTETLGLRPIVAVAQLDAGSIDQDARTAEVTFYSGAAVLRFPMFDDPYELEFEVSRKAADLTRLNGGAPVINNHDTYTGVEAMLGVVEKAWIEKGQARARMRFSRRAAVEPIWQDVLDGVIRSVSMGTYVGELKEVTEKGAEMKRMRATSWQPYEISLVPVPADPGAQFSLSDDQAESRPCVVTYAEDSAEKEPTMTIQVRLLADIEDLGSKGDIVEIPEADFDAQIHTKELAAPTPQPTPTPTPSVKDADETLRAAIAADELRAKRVKDAAAHYKLDATWAQRHIDLGTEIDQVLAEAAEERAKRAPRTSNDIGFGDDHESATWRRERMEDALAARASRNAPPEEARQYAEFSLVECAIECLGFQGRSRGLTPRSDRSEVIELALHTTSDFPLLLGNVLNKMLLPEYQNASPTYRMLAEQKTFRDFRPHRFLRSGDFPVPLQVNEHGEFKYGTMGENEEQVTAATYGRILGLSRQALVNDDLASFNDMATKAGRRIADFENATFFSVCLLAGSGLGPDLSDTNAVYDAAHNNVASAGALSNTLLEEAFGLMAAQTSLDGLKLNIAPRYLLVSPTSFGLAKRLLADINPTQASEVNTFAGVIEPLSDANLTGTRFYVLSAPTALANYVYGYLEGATGPRTQVREGFEIDGVEFKVALDFGVGAIDYRGGVSGAGA